MTKVSLYLCHETAYGKTAAGGADFELLNIYLKPIPSNVPANRAVSVGLNHIDISYEGDGGDPVDAEVTINPSSAAAYIYYYSKYDVNRDGKVTLADVDLVRRFLGKDDTMPEWHANILIRRSDVAEPANGVIDLADLAAIIAAYEATLP
jgi:hypothetical protein